MGRNEIQPPPKSPVWGGIDLLGRSFLIWVKMSRMLLSALPIWILRTYCKWLWDNAISYSSCRLNILKKWR